jgi:holin-like protein
MLQIGLLLAFWLAAELLVLGTDLPIPAGIVGMFLVLALLASRLLRLGSMRRGASCFLAEMLLFFIPAVPAVLDHPEFIGWLGLKVMAVILLGTAAVMATTAMTIDLCGRWISRHGHA